MITAHIKTVQNFLDKKNLDAILLTSASNVSYTSNFIARLSTEREAFVLITKTHAYIFTSKLCLEEVKTEKDIIAIELSVKNPLHKALKEILEKEKLQTVGFEENNLTFREHEKLAKHISSLLPVNLYELRMIKQREEIEKIAKACEIGDKAFEFILSEIHEGITEEKLALNLENFIRNQYAALSFPTIVAFGKNAAVAHHATGKTKLEKNQFVLLDFGVLFENYCSDMTRTVFFGKPTPEEKKAHETVRVSQEKAIEYLKSSYSSSEAESRIEKPFDYAQGINSSRLRSNNNLNGSRLTVNAKDVDKTSRDYIISQGYPSFPHSLGHGIGIDVHEAPSLSPYSEELLEQGMVFSVEPGIYIDHTLGIRIEDLVAITDKGLVELTHAPKEFILV